MVSSVILLFLSIGVQATERPESPHMRQYCTNAIYDFIPDGTDPNRVGDFCKKCWKEDRENKTAWTALKKDTHFCYVTLR